MICFTTKGNRIPFLFPARAVCIIVLVVYAVVAAFSGPIKEASQILERDISFRTDDGWTIHGVLTIPAKLAPGKKIPAAVLLHAPVHDSEIFGHNGYPSLREALEKGNIATLRIDIRGRGKSADPKEYHRFTLEERSRVALDVRGALDFLGALKEVDSSRIALVAEGATAEAALVIAFNDHRVSALSMLSGRIGQSARDVIASRVDLPLLCVVSREDKVGFADMTEACNLSRSPNSTLMAYRDIGVGNSMFITWAAKFPEEKPLQITVGEWLISKLRLAPESREVSFQTEDGWTIYASLRVPRSNNSQTAPGVVLVHSNLSDRHVYDDLELMLADAGLAVLNIDFRGRGKSHGKGFYFAIPQEERDKAYLDVQAGLSFLASQTDVDAKRLAVIGTAIGTKYALKAANSNRQVSAFVMLGGLPDRAEVEKSTFPILFVSTLGVPAIANAFRDFYGLTKNRGSQLIEHEGGALGYQIFEIDEDLQPFIVRWLKSLLAQKEN